MGPSRGISINTEQPDMTGGRSTTGIPDRKKVIEVLEGFIKRGKVSLSDAQRHHKLGFNRAKGIIQTLVDAGFIHKSSKGYNFRSDLTIEQFKKETHNYKQQKRPRLR